MIPFAFVPKDTRLLGVEHPTFGFQSKLNHVPIVGFCEEGTYGLRIGTRDPNLHFFRISNPEGTQFTLMTHEPTEAEENRRYPFIFHHSFYMLKDRGIFQFPPSKKRVWTIKILPPNILVLGHIGLDTNNEDVLLIGGGQIAQLFQWKGKLFCPDFGANQPFCDFIAQVFQHIPLKQLPVLGDCHETPKSILGISTTPQFVR